MKKFLRINDLKEISPPGGGGHRYLLSFDVGTMTGSKFNPTDTSQQVTVTSSGTLQSVWGKNDDQMAESSATAATSLILKLASQGPIDQLNPIELNTYTAPEIPPTTPQVMAGVIIPLPDHKPVTGERTNFSFLSDDVAELRDQINALSRNMFGERLLELPQERAILDVYKPAQSTEEFRNRVQSLAGICTAMNKALLGKHTNKQSTKDIGSIVLLEELLTSLSDTKRAAEVCDALKNINELRKGYPAHGDNTDKFLPAHDFFSIPYPVTNFPVAWEAILGGYFRAMKALLQILSTERQKNHI